MYRIHYCIIYSYHPQEKVYSTDGYADYQAESKNHAIRKFYDGIAPVIKIKEKLYKTKPSVIIRKILYMEDTHHDTTR